ncbi:hypothetical protein Tco_0127922 [Tanacetum coccineum]
MWHEFREAIFEKISLNKKCMGYLVRAYYSISPTRYYKDDSCWSADLKSKATEDIISIGKLWKFLFFHPIIVLLGKILEIKWWMIVSSTADVEILASRARGSTYKHKVIIVGSPQCSIQFTVVTEIYPLQQHVILTVTLEFNFYYGKWSS